MFIPEFYPKKYKTQIARIHADARGLNLCENLRNLRFYFSRRSCISHAASGNLQASEICLDFKDSPNMRCNHRLRPSAAIGMAIAFVGPRRFCEPPLNEGLRDESFHVAAIAVLARLGDVRRAARLPRRLRARLTSPTMIWITVIVTALLFIYLLAALLRPEWF